MPRQTDKTAVWTREELEDIGAGSRVITRGGLEYEIRQMQREVREDTTDGLEVFRVYETACRGTVFAMLTDSAHENDDDIVEILSAPTAPSVSDVLNRYRGLR